MKYIEIRRNFTLVFSIALLLIANIVQGQEIAPLPSDPAVRSGQLPNGLKWYVAVNPAVQGMADFALVQHTGFNTVPSISKSTIQAIANESLQSQPLLKSPTVKDFFSEKGSVPGPEGFAQVRENTTIFRFNGVNLRHSATVLDSSLFVLMNMAGRACWSEDLVLKKWYTPSDQAIIVSGDVSAEEVLNKLKMLSYMIPEAAAVPRVDYVWKDQPGVNAEVRAVEGSGVAKISAVWRLERSPRELMHTIQPAIQEKYMTMTGIIARDRILKYFRENDMPVASVDFRYKGGAGTLGDGEFALDVVVAAENAKEAISVMAETMSSIDNHGVETAETYMAGLEFADMLAEENGRRNVSNREYVNRCASAFIYNTPLSSRQEVINFHTSKDLSTEVEKGLVSSVASASIAGDRNLTLKCVSGSVMSEDSLKTLFASAWQEAIVADAKKLAIEPVPYLPSPESKVSIKSKKNEYLSGGSIWTLSNGMRVIFRNMPQKDNKVHYSLSLNGGVGNVDSLGEGCGKYLEDYLDHCRIAGVSGAAFRDALRKRGMKMSWDVTPSATKIKGFVPEDDLEYMLRALLVLMNERELDESEWEYYCKGENLRQLAGVASGTGVCLDGGFKSKADAFFRKLSQNVNNGVLVLVGNIDEKILKTALVNYAGSFKTSKKTFTRTEIRNRNFTGTEGYRKPGDEECVSASLTAPMALTAENYYTAAMTALVLRRHLAMSLAGKGMYSTVGCRCSRFPQENVQINALVGGVENSEYEFKTDEALAILKKIFDDLPSIPLEDHVLASYRYRLEKQLVYEKQNPEYWVNALNLRYLDGKDFTTGAEAKIQSINEAKIRALLTVLGNDSKMEYVITEK